MPYPIISILPEKNAYAPDRSIAIVVRQSTDTKLPYHTTIYYRIKYRRLCLI